MPNRIADATQVIPRVLCVRQKSAQIKRLHTRHCQRNQKGLHDRASVTDEPEKLLAIEWLFAEVSRFIFCRSRTRIGSAKVAA